MSLSRTLLIAAAVGCLAAGGCKTRTLPDPNDPSDVGYLQPEVLRRDMKYASDSLIERRVKGEIDDARFKELMAQYANDLLEKVNLKQVPPSKAWEYAEVFITARRWKEAAQILQIAVKAARNQDRFVNDSLRLARADCHLGKVKEAIPLARATFKTDPPDKAPILYGILFEIVPEGRGQGQDVALAELLEDATHQAEETVVDVNSDPGKAFIAARPRLIGQAWDLVFSLYTDSGHQDLADAARKRSITGAPREGIGV